MSTPPPGRLAYRPDIDGLRALAVLPVVFYHAGVAGFTGGFVGVDVFFVISGYLITSIVAADMEAGRFTLSGFYERRVRRIFPALFLVVAASVPAALVILVPENLEDFGQSVMATALFASNVFFYFENGYFDGPAELYPLLHTWSLAVEEQFYLLFPLLLLLLARWRLPRSRVLLGLAAASFAFAVWQVEVDPDGAFYLLPGRFWELMTGALLALRPLPAIRSPAAAALAVLAGLMLIGGAVVGYTEHVPFPGAGALLPCLGALLVIHGGRTRNVLSALLGSWPLKGVGLISYSLYLWHFPLIVFARHLMVRPFTGAEVALLVALSLGLSVLSWRYVEQPFRKRSTRLDRRALLRFAGLAMAASVGFGLYTDFSDGAPWRLPAPARAYLDAKQERDVTCLRRGENCRLGTAGAPTEFLLWGDSHANVLLPVFDAAARQLGVAGRAVLEPGCPPVAGVRLPGRKGAACADAVQRGLHAAMAPGIRQVYLMGRWTLLVEESRYGFESGPVPVLLDARTGAREGNGLLLERGLDLTVERLRSAGREVVLVGPVPEVGWHVPRTLAQRARFGRWLDDAAIEPDLETFRRRNGRTLEILQRVAGRQGARLILPHRWLCEPGGRCPVERNGRLLYYDTDHLTVTGAMGLLPMVRADLGSWAGSAAAEAPAR